ncbi:L-carnitine/gamma-butyrobetaine antiport BCCT transporter [Campylobacter sp. RM12642]|uniref:L-carnitine/gamma-butyrobetaine antiporter n=1 Tax=Campylobacter sp. RM12642 TaxID=2735736 RepID=UPI0030142721|nr:L-carnitine/gamma-butyrobetaine antiport BCCT transporter [Campylobacter sp. RM12642]
MVEKRGIEPKVFFPSLFVVILLGWWVISDLDAANATINKTFDFVTQKFGFLFEWYMVAMLAGFFWLVFGPLSKRKLGDGDPEYSTISWIFMMFASCTSAAIIYWAVLEVYYYSISMPFGYEKMSYEAMDMGLPYSMFHWGPLPWASYALLTIAFGYFMFVKKMDTIRPSGTLAPAIGEKLANGWLGTIIDNVYVVCLILAMGTSLGLATPIVTECMQWLFGIEHTLMLDATIVSCWVVFNAICVALGISKGIKIASDIRTYLMIIMLGYVFILGSTTFMLNYFTDSIGIFITNFAKMIFYTDGIRSNGFPQAWTVFYWCWYIVYGISMSIFLARISKGRTIGQLCIGIVAGISASTWIMWGILGGNTMHLMVIKGLDIPAVIEKSGAFRAVIETWATLPMPTVCIFGFFIFAFIATITLINGCAYTLAMSTCKGVKEDEEPPLFIRIGWSILVGVVGVTLLALGGLKPIQTAIIVGGCPLFFVNILIIYAFLKDAKKMNWF